MLLSLILFGSRARGDHRLSSDVDLLGVVDGGTIKDEVSSRGASFYRYPIASLQKKSEAGDLFLLHLTTEGRILHDTAGLFLDVCQRFQFQDNYHNEIREASAIVWFLASRPKLIENRLLRKRLIWAFRTILIARSAEQRTPAFSSAALAKFSGMPELKSAIDKRFALPSDALCKVAKRVTSDFGHSRDGLRWPSNMEAQRDFLTELGGVAKATVERSQRGRKNKALPQHSTGHPYL